MELERMNPEGGPEAPEEEKSDEGRSCWACTNCDSFHETVSKWMLPEDNRVTYLERANCIPPPIFILAISVAELTTFIYYAVSKPQEQWLTLGSGILNSPFTYRPDKRKEAWRFLSYMLVHAGIEHILGNLFLQLLLGIPLELVHKGHKVGLVYIAGVIAGSLASSVCDPLHSLVGASGGVYALIGGYFMNVLVNFQEMIPLFGVARLLFIFLIVGTDVGFALYRRFSPADPHLVSFVAHIAGGLAGMSVGYVIFSSFDHNFIKDPRFWVSIVAYLVFVGFAIFFNVFFSPANW
uniref:rhomboid-related protein 2 n=1 Tax=Euleptes europaea TaxID=460621 RepID=UPI00253FB8A9|nr:rhomboid-related protein 2 [Euleptes europaea]